MRMAQVIAGVMGLCLLFTFILVYVNRASSEVVGAALPVAFAAMSALGLVFAFGKPAPIERSFPVVFVFQQKDKYPITLPGRPAQFLTIGMFDKAIQANPRLLEDPRFADGNGHQLFHEFLQKAIVNWMRSRYWATWRLRQERFDIGGQQEEWGAAPDASEFATKKLSDDEVTSALGKNAFANVPAFGPGTLGLPPRTSFEVKEPGDDPKLGHTSEIRLKNWLCDIRIHSRFSSSGVGLGAYTMFLGIPQEEAQKQFHTVQYIVRFSATFSPYLKGHPQMAAHREWAEGMLDGLMNEFDEQAMWKRTTEAYILRQHLPDEAKKVPLMFGPIRSSQPSK
jgi:hypothetical protein